MLKAKRPVALSIILVSAICTYAADNPKKSKPLASMDGKAKVSITFSSRNGKTTKVPRIQASVLIHSADAAKAFAYGHVKWNKTIDNTGKPLEIKKPIVSFDDPTTQFLRIKRGGPFAKHPKDGVAVTVDLDPAGREVKQIKLLSGTVKLRISEARRSWLVPVLALKLPAKLRGEQSHPDAALKKLGFTLKLQKAEMSINKKKMYYYQIAFVDSAKRPDLIAKIEFLDSNKMPPKELKLSLSPGKMTFGTVRQSTVDLNAENLTKLIKLKGYLRISVYDKITEKVVPFKVENIKVTQGRF
jgi:hypothetical protein